MHSSADSTCRNNIIYLSPLEEFRGHRLWHRRPPYDAEKFAPHHPSNVLMQIRLFRWSQSTLFAWRIEYVNFYEELCAGLPEEHRPSRHRMTKILRCALQYDPRVGLDHRKGFAFHHRKELYLGLGHMMELWLPEFIDGTGAPPERSVAGALRNIQMDDPADDHEIYVRGALELGWGRPALHLTEQQRETFPWKSENSTR